MAFQPVYVALITVGGRTYEYYGNAEDELSLVEERPTLRLVEGQIENYQLPHQVAIVPLFSTQLKIPREQFEPLSFTVGNHEIEIEQLYTRGGEAVIYKGRLDHRPVIFKMYTRAAKKLRGLPSEIRDYLPERYLLLKEGRGRYVVVMQPLQEVVYSDRIYQQSLEFLKRMEALNEVHGDISPGNLMMDAEGNVKFIDFLRLRGGTPFYSKGNTDRQALGRVLLGFKYAPFGLRCHKCTLRKLYEVYRSSHPEASEAEFFQWFQCTFPQDQQSLHLLQMV